jgi:hypothetical protein
VSTVSQEEKEREKLINQFVIRVFKLRAKNIPQEYIEIKLKAFIRARGKKWSPRLQLLFDSSMKKDIPQSVLRKLNLLEPKIKPNAKQQQEHEPNIKPKRKYRQDRVDEFEEEFDDPRYDYPIEAIPEVTRTCTKCNNKFVQNKDYVNRMLCPKCDAWSKNIFSINNIYASSDEIIDQQQDKKHKALKIRPL